MDFMADDTADSRSADGSDGAATRKSKIFLNGYLFRITNESRCYWIGQPGQSQSNKPPQ
jgi:hypothetical protein